MALDESRPVGMALKSVILSHPALSLDETIQRLRSSYEAIIGKLIDIYQALHSQVQICCKDVSLSIWHYAALIAY